MNIFNIKKAIVITSGKLELLDPLEVSTFNPTLYAGGFIRPSEDGAYHFTTPPSGYILGPEVDAMVTMDAIEYLGCYKNPETTSDPSIYKVALGADWVENVRNSYKFRAISLKTGRSEPAFIFMN